MKEQLKCLILKAKKKEFKGTKNERDTIVYLVANGGNMGRWTSFFGVHCLADTNDTKEYLKQIAKITEHSTIVKYSVIPTNI